MNYRRFSVLAVCLFMLIGAFTPGANAQELPRIEITLHVDVSALDTPSEMQAEIASLIQSQLELEEYPVTEVTWIDATQLSVTMPFDEDIEIDDLRYFFRDPLLLLDPEVDPAVQLEFVDFSDIAFGQMSEGACILTTAHVAQTEAALAETEDIPAYTDYTCPPETDGGTPVSAQLQADGTPFRTVMTGKGLSSADAQPSAWDLRQWVITFSLASESDEAAAFLDYVANNANRPLAIVLDGRLLSYPTIQPGLAQEARDGEMDGGVITGSFTRYEARLLAAQLQGGALPVPMDIAKIEIVFIE